MKLSEILGTTLKLLPFHSHARKPVHEEKSRNPRFLSPQKITMGLPPHLLELFFKISQIAVLILLGWSKNSL